MVCIVVSVLSGETEVSLLLIFPVFSGSSALFLLGVAFIVFSFIAGFLSLMMGQLELAGMEPYAGQETPPTGVQKEKTRYGGVVLLGPVPIAFGSDKTIALVMLVIGVALAVLVLLLLLLG